MFWDRFRKQIPPANLEHLRPGPCECEHDRSSHVGGKGKCMGQWPPDEDLKEWSNCACQIYIRDNEGGSEDVPETPTPSELEKLYQL